MRCEIVHRGKTRLSESERYQFVRLQWISKRVIQEEVRLLGNDLKEDGKETLL